MIRTIRSNFGVFPHLTNSVQFQENSPDGPAGAILVADVLTARPPWHVVSSRELARALGVSLQTLANWRIRDKGPPPEPPQLYKGNRIYYRIDRVLSWRASRAGEDVPPWRYCRSYLEPLFPQLQSADEAEVVQLIAALEDGGVFHHAWPRKRRRGF